MEHFVSLHALKARKRVCGAVVIPVSYTHLKHVENITGVYKLPCVVAINRFATDGDEEIKLLQNELSVLGVNAVCTECLSLIHIFTYTVVRRISVFIFYFT